MPSLLYIIPSIYIIPLIHHPSYTSSHPYTSSLLYIICIASAHTSCFLHAVQEGLGRWRHQRQGGGGGHTQPIFFIMFYHACPPLTQLAPCMIRRQRASPTPRRWRRPSAATPARRPRSARCARTCRCGRDEAWRGGSVDMHPAPAPCECSRVAGSCLAKCEAPSGNSTLIHTLLPLQGSQWEQHADPHSAPIARLAVGTARLSTLCSHCKAPSGNSTSIHTLLPLQGSQ
eukprot:365795-Chlamydomonas_euryale.AAC.9